MVTNFAQIYGKIISPPNFSHSVYEENFFGFEIEVCRLSGRVDHIPCIISEKKLALIAAEEQVFYGQVRSYNRQVEGTNRLDIRLFVRDVMHAEDRSLNSVSLVGYVCKQPVYRRTPFGREITDMLLAVNRAYNKSDYIPIITWGKNARIAREMRIGQKISIEGRLQSREYEKQLDETTRIRRTAYEVSVAELHAQEE